MPTAFKISFENKNSSLQINDVVHVSDVDPITKTLGPHSVLGVIKRIEGNSLFVEVDASYSGAAQDIENMFVFFSKPIQVNESSLKGYYADITLRNESKKYAELFAVSSEIALSSK
jgi:hypothetical protein